MTGFVPVMWAIWGVLVLAMLALKIYTGRLSRDEDDQLILDDAFDHLKTEQVAIMAKVKKVKPLNVTSRWLALAATLFVVGYYVIDVVNQFK
jgi:hypothetical protein